jgi:hypothetical protein
LEISWYTVVTQDGLYEGRRKEDRERFGNKRTKYDIFYGAVYTAL